MTAPVAITLCGSLTRAADDIARVHRALALAGYLVDAPVPATPGEPAATAEQRARLDARHLAAIDRSHHVIAVVPDGHRGEATDAETAYAEAAGRVCWTVTDVDKFIAEVGPDTFPPVPDISIPGPGGTVVVLFGARDAHGRLFDAFGPEDARLIAEDSGETYGPQPRQVVTWRVTTSEPVPYRPSAVESEAPDRVHGFVAWAARLNRPALGESGVAA